MGEQDKAEACGRCTMTTVVDLTGVGTDPYEGDRIELADDELRAVSTHAVALGRLRERLDSWATKFAYGR